MDTVTSSVIAGYLLIFGTIQLLMYRKYAIPIEDPTQISRSKLYYFQIFLLLLVPTLAATRFILQGFVYEGARIYGFMVSGRRLLTLSMNLLLFKCDFHFQILAVSLTAFSFLYSILLLIKERYYLLPSVPTRGHGLVLLLFWSLVFIGENLAFINLKREDWWFHFKTVKDKTEMSLFVARYVSCLFIFVLGLKAPGILSHREDDYIHLEHDTNSVSSSD